MKTPKYLKPISGNEQQAKFVRALESFQERGKGNSLHILEALHIAAAIEYLRSAEADTVTILCDNPEPDTLQDQCAIECNGAWTNYEDKRFQGKNVLQSLFAACKAREEVETPRRIQLSRKKGFKLPPNTVVVSRPSKWGNPYRICATMTREQAVEEFKSLMETGGLGFLNSENVQTHLRGKNLACWCKPGQPCHADILLKIANSQ